MDTWELDTLDKWVDYKQVTYGLEREIECVEKLGFETLDK